MTNLDDEPGKYKKHAPEAPAGWVWKEQGARGPTWYPPIREAAVDAGGEHLALCTLVGDREPDVVVARAGFDEADELVFQLLDRSAATVEAVERLNDSCFEELGSPPTFELAYDWSKKTANKQYLDPMWVYREGA